MAIKTTAGTTRPNEEDKTKEEHDKGPHHAYKDLDRSVRNIFVGSSPGEQAIEEAYCPSCHGPQQL
jgi:hypothetical protein